MAESTSQGNYISPTGVVYEVDDLQGGQNVDLNSVRFICTYRPDLSDLTAKRYYRSDGTQLPYFYYNVAFVNAANQDITLDFNTVYGYCVRFARGSNSYGDSQLADLVGPHEIGGPPSRANPPMTSETIEGQPFYNSAAWVEQGTEQLRQVGPEIIPLLAPDVPIAHQLEYKLLNSPDPGVRVTIGTSDGTLRPIAKFGLLNLGGNLAELPPPEPRPLYLGRKHARKPKK